MLVLIIITKSNPNRIQGIALAIPTDFAYHLKSNFATFHKNENSVEGI